MVRSRHASIRADASRPLWLVVFATFAACSASSPRRRRHGRRWDRGREPRALNRGRSVRDRRCGPTSDAMAPHDGTAPSRPSRRRRPRRGRTSRRTWPAWRPECGGNTEYLTSHPAFDMLITIVAKQGAHGPAPTEARAGICCGRRRARSRSRTAARRSSSTPRTPRRSGSRVHLTTAPASTARRTTARPSRRSATCAPHRLRERRPLDPFAPHAARGRS